MDVLCWQKLQLASLPIDDMDLRSFEMALRRLQALNVWSVRLSSTACKGTLEQLRFDMKWAAAQGWYHNRNPMHAMCPSS